MPVCSEKCKFCSSVFVCLEFNLLHQCVLCSCICVLNNLPFLQNQDYSKAAAFYGLIWLTNTFSYEVQYCRGMKKTLLHCSWCWPWMTSSMFYRHDKNFMILMVFKGAAIVILYQAHANRYETCHVFYRFALILANIFVFTKLLYVQWFLSYRVKTHRSGAVLNNLHFVLNNLLARYCLCFCDGIVTHTYLFLQLFSCKHGQLVPKYFLRI